jgi:NADPH:quinone reductase-like Zn-dependent oxidoreductase
VAAFSALQALRDKGKVQPGHKALVNGAAGGVGTFAVQIARAFGAEVTGVCSTENVEMVASIGADHLVDCTQQDFTQNGQRYDWLVDTVANRTLSECSAYSRPRGQWWGLVADLPASSKWLCSRPS